MDKTERLMDKTLRLTDRLVDISFRDESISFYCAHNLMITTMLTDMVVFFANNDFISHHIHQKLKKPLTAVSGFFVSINIRIDYPKLSYIILLPLIFNELRLSGDGIARKRHFGSTPVDHFVDADKMVLQACEPLLTRLGIEPDDYCNHYSEERCKCHYCVDHTLICLKF